MAALQELTSDKGSLATSDDPTSLLLTSHRQNFSHSLTNVTDSCFGFFCQVNEVRLQNNKVAENRSSTPEQLRSKIIDHQNLLEAWQKLFAHPNKRIKHMYFLVMNSDNQIHPRWQAGGGRDIEALLLDHLVRGFPLLRDMTKRMEDNTVGKKKK